MCTKILFLALLFASAALAGREDNYNVVWDSPSTNSWGSMPIGNGDIGANVWVEPFGDLVLLLSKTDSWDEVSRLCKLGRIRIKLPSVENFRQELRLADGEIRITGGGVTTRVWIDANQPVVHVEINGDKPFTTSVTHETWRTMKRQLSGGEIRGSWGLSRIPTAERPSVVPDVVLHGQKDQIVFFHRNPASVWAAHMRMQQLDALANPSDDPLLQRTFGAVVRGSDLVSDGKSTLISKTASTQFAISITALTQQTPTADAWVEKVTALADAADRVPLERARAEHAQWWRDFWNRSWIVVTGDKNAEAVTRGYAFQRWMNACAGRGGAPIKFNGSIFNVDCVHPIKSYIGICNFDADFRQWGDAYWWQNTRLIYWTMPAAGDFNLMQPMFKMYTDALPLRKNATKKYFKHDGAFFPEIIEHWGSSYGTRDTYQWDPANPLAPQLWWGKPRSTSLGAGNQADLTTPPGWYWQSGIEMVAVMLSYYNHTGDTAFRDEKLLPFAYEILRFYDVHWPHQPNGKLHFFPLSSIEAIQNATNPMPDVAGLHFILPQLIACTPDAKQKTAWQKMLARLPSLPLGDRNGTPCLLPAEKGKRHSHHENPELYAVWPYELFGVGKQDLTLARNAWLKRADKSNKGWSQNSIQAAMLGLTDEAKMLVTEKFSQYANGFRFLAMWGPNFNWIPDQDHGSIGLIALQKMLLQTDGKRILLLSAWPKDWDCDFKLHAPQNTTVEGVLRNGKLEQLKVSPPERQKDVVIWKETEK